MKYLFCRYALSVIAAVLFCSCGFDTSFDPDDPPGLPEPPGYKAYITEVICNNEVILVFDKKEDWELPPGCGTPQIVTLAGVEELRLPTPEGGTDWDPYAEQAKKQVERFEGKTVYFEHADGYGMGGGMENRAVPALLYLPYEHRYRADTLNELILKDGCGRYAADNVPQYLQRQFEEADKEALEKGRGMHSNDWDRDN